ncbi:MAG: uracil-DNA glycosylase [Candidatus Kariarchaeaceae archaeon]|jgi:DNA polymerase
MDLDTHEELILNMKSCNMCPLATTRTQVVVGDYAPIEGSICFIGEAPGYYEDRDGRPFVGRSGKLLDQMLDEIGLSRSTVSVLNIIKCRPPNNRTPSSEEMKTCGQAWLDDQIRYLKPAFLVTLGSVALKYFSPKSKMTQSKGIMMDSDNGIPLIPLFHPAYILRSGNALLDEYRSDFKNLQRVLKASNKVKMVTEPTSHQNLEDFFPNS